QALLRDAHAAALQVFYEPLARRKRDGNMAKRSFIGHGLPRACCLLRLDRGRESTEFLGFSPIPRNISINKIVCCGRAVTRWQRVIRSDRRTANVAILQPRRRK